VLHLAGPLDAVEGEPARVGFVVGKTVGAAVVRNRVRRRLRHLVRDRLAELPPASTLVVRALAAAADASYAELRDDLARCLGRVAPVTSPS
jgi:ribonuclease P protein component